MEQARLLLDEWRTEGTSLIGRLVVFPSESGERSELTLDFKGRVAEFSNDSLRLTGGTGINSESFTLSISLSDATFLLSDAWKAPLPVRSLAVRRFSDLLVIVLPYGYCRLHKPHE
jgi:hypothetical protein